jgi:hypothetical protein
MTKLAYLLIAAAPLAACSSPVSFSTPVGINLKAKSGDVATGAITESKDITTESGNPYGAFISDAMMKLGGKDPSTIELNSLTLTLGGTSTGVTTLQDVFTGTVDVAFITNDTNITYDAGTISNPMGVGPLGLDVTFDYSKVSAADQPKFMTGSFKVVLRGTAQGTFATKGAEADLLTSFTFDALE